MTFYVYGGNEFDAKPNSRPKRPEKPFDPTLCGTASGVWQHRRSKQPLCAACKAEDNARRHGVGKKGGVTDD